MRVSTVLRIKMSASFIDELPVDCFLKDFQKVILGDEAVDAVFERCLVVRLRVHVSTLSPCPFIAHRTLFSFQAIIARGFVVFCNGLRLEMSVNVVPAILFRLCVRSARAIVADA
jgi:hypothetical protein